MNVLSAPLVLVGPMGVGKTTIGKKLAHLWNVPFIDTDALIVKEHGEISKIFETRGEAFFREVETNALKHSLVAPAVIATGGGIILSEENRTLLRNQQVIYLVTNGKHISHRLQGTRRPLLKNGVSDWQKIYQERKPLYELVAKHTIETSNLPLKSIISAIEGLNLA